MKRPLKVHVRPKKSKWSLFPFKPKFTGPLIFYWYFQERKYMWINSMAISFTIKEFLFLVEHCSFLKPNKSHPCIPNPVARGHSPKFKKYRLVRRFRARLWQLVLRLKGETPPPTLSEALPLIIPAGKRLAWIQRSWLPGRPHELTWRQAEKPMACRQEKSP